MKKILLDCPICNARKFQLIPEEILHKRNQYDKGIVVILIPKDTICEHLFFVHVDKNFSVRDTFSESETDEDMIFKK